MRALLEFKVNQQSIAKRRGIGEPPVTLNAESLKIDITEFLLQTYVMCDISLENIMHKLRIIQKNSCGFEKVSLTTHLRDLY